MPQEILPPLVKSEYTARDRAIIAGYLIKMRAGTLRALTSVGAATVGATSGWAEGNQRYYRDAERYSRYLLYWLGYETEKGRNYEEVPSG
jgi:hypothetical protein